MLSIGKSGLSQLRFTSFYLVDESLTPAIARALYLCGYDIVFARDLDEFKGKDLVSDEEIVEWLGGHGRQKSVWITADKDAAKAHAKFIISKQNSVIWVFRPKTGLSSLHELILISLIIEHVNDLITNAGSPLYLRASFLKGKKAKLERLVSPLTQRHLQWKRIPLPK